MRALIQRVTGASVTIEGRETGAIGAGLVALVGLTGTDTPAEVAWMADKILGLRVFSDDEGKMNRSVTDVGGGILVVSQFTLYGDVRKGRRPSFVDAARPEVAIPLYEAFIVALRAARVDVQTGEFGADMQVALVNDGPVTIWVEREHANAGSGS